jgi:transcriptional regulator with XRE-family HTH domain
MPQHSLVRNREELSSFIRRHREQLKPEDVGLLPNGRRRTNGLRREEVAALAGVGLTWYTWFEQGREVKVSPAFLENVARALRMDSTERAHLFLLSGYPAPAEKVRFDGSIPPCLQDLVDSMVGRPAYVKDARWQILAWNAAATYVFGDFNELPPHQRNTLWLTFTDSPFRRTMVSWEEDARRIVGKYRVIHTRFVDDPAVRELVSNLESVSPEFRRLWRQHEVLDRGKGVRQVNVAEIGSIRFDYMILRLEGIEGLTLVAYSPDPNDSKSPRFVEACARLPRSHSLRQVQ